MEKEHGLVLATVAASWLVHHGVMAFSVMGARKKYGVKYPVLYASAAECKSATDREAYNCVQRAHQNSLELLPTFYALLLCAGLRFPITASIGGAIYLIGRIVYFKGYASGEPDKRLPGAAFYYAGFFTLLGCVVRSAWQLLLG